MTENEYKEKINKMLKSIHSKKILHEIYTVIMWYFVK